MHSWWNSCRNFGRYNFSKNSSKNTARNSFRIFVEIFPVIPLEISTENFQEIPSVFIKPFLEKKNYSCRNSLTDCRADPQVNPREVSSKIFHSSSNSSRESFKKFSRGASECSSRNFPNDSFLKLL